MGNHANNINLIVHTIDRFNIHENSLVEILEIDLDFEGDKAIEVSKEIFDEFKVIEDELTRVEGMVKNLFERDNFIGDSSHYGDYTYEITETEFQFVISIAYIS